MWEVVLELILVIATVVFAAKYITWKKTIKNLANALMVLSNAIDDDEITQEEARDITQALRAVLSADDINKILKFLGF